mgnify:CR=1 FL=1
MWLYLSDRNNSIFERFVETQQAKKEKKEEKKQRKAEKKRRLKEWKKQQKVERKRRKQERKDAKKQKEQKEDEPIFEDVQEPVGEPIDIPNTSDDERTSGDGSEGTPLQEFIAGVSPDEDQPEVHENVEQEVGEDELNQEEPIIEIDLNAELPPSPPVPMDDMSQSDSSEFEGEHEVEMGGTLVVVSKLKRMKDRLRFYYYTLFLHKATAKDYYVPMVSIECLAFFYMVLCQNAFSYNPPEDYSFILLESRFPTSFFFILLLQFLFIVIDRIIYLFRSVLCKVILQYVTLFYYTLLLFFILPNGQGKQFDEIWVLILFYGMKCIYWWISALQICEGYPANIQKRWMTQSYGMFHRYLFEVYLVIPFLFELRSMLDWSIFDTTLNFFQWMKLEDIYRNLYQVKCKRVGEESRNWYEKQSFITKNVVGMLAFIGLIALLWFPLFLLSSANPTNQPNPVVDSTFEISVTGFSSFYHNDQDQEMYTATSSQFDSIRKTFPSVTGDESSDTQIIDLHLVRQNSSSHCFINSSNFILVF